MDSVLSQQVVHMRSAFEHILKVVSHPIYPVAHLCCERHRLPKPHIHFTI